MNYSHLHHPPIIVPHDIISSYPPESNELITIILSYGHASDQEPEQAIHMHTTPLKSEPHDAISTDYNEPIQAIHVSTVPQQLVLMISLAVISPESNECITIYNDIVTWPCFRPRARVSHLHTHYPIIR